MAKPKNVRLPKELLDGIYVPEFLPDELQLNEFVSIVDNTEAEETIRNKIASSVDSRLETPRKAPMTEAEAAVADIAIEETLERLSAVRQRIGATRKAVDDIVGEAGSGRPGGEINFDVNIKRKPFLKKAVRKIFGEKRNSITYSMYVEALAIKRQIEKDQADGYTSGEFFVTKEGESS